MALKAIVFDGNALNIEIPITSRQLMSLAEIGNPDDFVLYRVKKMRAGQKYYDLDRHIKVRNGDVFQSLWRFPGASPA